VSLSARHLQDLHLPDKAIDVIDEAGAAQKLMPEEQRAGEIGPQQIEQIVAKMARVPVQAVSSDDRRALQALDVELKRVIFGQNDAIDEVASAIKMSRSGRPASARPSWRASCRGFSASNSCASTCPSTWKSTPSRA
jgi:ATP-dependent Clp protease ATP-binding subunit ClpA